MWLRNGCKKITLLPVSPAKCTHPLLRAGMEGPSPQEMMGPQGWFALPGGPAAARGPFISDATASSSVSPPRSSGPRDQLGVTGRASARLGCPRVRRRVPHPWSRDAMRSDPSATRGDPEHIWEQKRRIRWSFSRYKTRLPAFPCPNPAALTWSFSADRLG